MQLPDPVKRRIEERADAVGFPTLQRAAALMSDAFREGNPVAFARLSAEQRAAAYLVTRMPATYAAATRVLAEVGEGITSVLDLGSGTGAASLAARARFPNAAITMIECDRALADAAHDWLPEATVRIEDLARIETLPPHDLVIAAYSLGELNDSFVRRFWEAAKVALVLIEPGTPKHYALLMRVRETLLKSGAHILAPCPAETPCPLVPPDWCHFAARVERTSLHRRLKQAELGYEDEKFSYLIFTKKPALPPSGRIIKRTKQEPGKITLETCTPQGLVAIQIRKKDDAYRDARKASWGDNWPPTNADERR